MIKDNNTDLAWLLLFVAWIVASIATLGSLFLSDVMMYTPCVLCWYQRIAMYPLMVIFLVGMLPFDKSVPRYATPFVLIGWLLSLYHNLLQYNVIPESASPCVQGVPCSTKYINVLGFLSIPMLSLLAFSIIAVLLYTIKKRG